LGLRPWLAALPLRERRLRARLLIVGSYWVVQWSRAPVRDTKPRFFHIARVPPNLVAGILWKP